MINCLATRSVTDCLVLPVLILFSLPGLSLDMYSRNGRKYICSVGSQAASNTRFFQHNLYFIWLWSTNDWLHPVTCNYSYSDSLLPLSTINTQQYLIVYLNGWAKPVALTPPPLVFGSQQTFSLILALSLLLLDIGWGSCIDATTTGTAVLICWPRLFRLDKT